MSTGLNSMVGIIYEDMIKPLVKKPLTERVASGILKIMVVIIGVICVGCVFLVSKLSSIIHVNIIILINYSIMINLDKIKYKIF